MTNTKTTTTLHDSPVPLRAKLAAAWTSFMFLYIYVDYLHLYKPGALTDILAGVVFTFDISQTFCRHSAHERSDSNVHDPALHDAARPCQPRHQPRRGNALHPLLGVQLGGWGVAGLLWSGRRTRGAAPGLHPALRLDLAAACLLADRDGRRGYATRARHVCQISVADRPPRRRATY